MTVNLTGFSQLIFNARLLPITSPAPHGHRAPCRASLRIHEGIRSWIEDISALTAGVVSWKTITLPFSEFKVAAQREACLATVESIAFVVVSGSSPAGTKVSGTLQLDNIRLQ